VQYTRAFCPGGSFFFTVVTYDRKPIFSDKAKIQILRESFRYAKSRHPFQINAFVLLPDHLHCILTLPDEDHDYSTRWMLIKSHFSRKCSIPDSYISASRKAKREKTIWQRRFWEHQIVDETDFINHVEYIHFNPVKHGYVDSAINWRYSSFRKFVTLGIYNPDWGSDENLKKDVGRE
jgi:putative transposase